MGSLSGRKILVTAGGTCEFIDNIRIITNISTGKTAYHIADELLKRGAEVYYIRAKDAEEPVKLMNQRHTEINIVTAQELMDQMKKYIIHFDIDTVIHAAAVSDFTFKRDGDIKLSSSSLEAFIEYIARTIQKTPKIIKLIKEWNPNVTLIGFKLTVGKSQKELYEIADTFCEEVKADMIIANDQKEIERAGLHRAHLLFSPDYMSDSSILKHLVYIAVGNLEIGKVVADYLDGKLGVSKKKGFKNCEEN